MAEIKVKGHESFYIREGWLRKGVVGIEKYEYLLSEPLKAVDELGVGANMVKSIRYWLQVVNLSNETRGENSKRRQNLTEGFGDIIFKNDPYFEDIGTLFLLHYKLASNKNLATSWFVFFNKIEASEMTKDIMYKRVHDEILNIEPGLVVSEKSIIDDCNCILKTYVTDNDDFNEPEDNMICPFTELGLIKKYENKNKETIVEKLTPSKKKLDKLIVLYVINENLKNKSRSVSIKSLLEDENNIGKIFNLNKNSVNQYIDELVDEGYLTVTRTAGLNTIYLTEKADNILTIYYEKN